MWAGARVLYPRTLDDVQVIARAAAASGRRVSVAGRDTPFGEATHGPDAMNAVRCDLVWRSPAFSTNDEHHCYFEHISVVGTSKCHEFFDDVATAWMRSPELAARPR